MLAADQIDRLRQHVSDEQWQAARMVLLCGYSYEDAAKRLAVPTGTIKSRIHAVRRIAKETLE